MDKKRKTSKTKPKDSYVYVIDLDEAILENNKFMDANPGYDEQKRCLYVGMTGRTPDIRFQQHKDGYKAARFVRKYGRYLRRRLYGNYNPMTREDAVKMEVELAIKLRKRGNAVWQN